MFANLVYSLLLTAAAPMIAWRMVRHGRYRRGGAEKLLGLSRRRAAEIVGDSSCIWIHAVSVGEVNLLRRLVRRFQVENRDCTVAISTSTDTGYDLAVKHFGEDRVFFCPLDFSWAVRRTLRNLHPEQLVLAELELWPNLIRLATQQGCHVAVFNGRLSERSARGYRRFSWLTRATFARLGWVGCQDQPSAQRFAACGTDPGRLQVTGSLKFDDAPTSRQGSDVRSRSQWAGVADGQTVWVLGSSGPGEEQMAVNVYQRLRKAHPGLRLIVVPRHPERFDAVAQSIAASGLGVRRRSESKLGNHLPWTSETVILVDTIGELRQWWGVGTIATVGGSFGKRGGQNMLEPAGYGGAVSFGPDTRNFKDIADRLIASRAAVRVDGESELESFVEQCLTDPSFAKALGKAARGVVTGQLGATEKTVRALTSARQKRARPIRRVAA